jgi:transcriptional regulator with XRE-family HTH domain
MQLIYKRLGRRIRKVRQENAVSQAALAKKVGFSRVSVVNIEAARQRLQLHDIAHFAKALRMRPGRLLDPVWEEKPRKSRDTQQDD